MESLKERLNWNHPRLISPDHPHRPWINLAVIILVTISSVMIGFSLIIADSSVQGALIIGDQKNLWFAIIFFLLVGTCVPIANWFADRFGHKLIFFLGAVLFLASIFLSAFTTNYWVMMIFRSLSSVGAGALFPTTLVLIEEMFSQKLKSFAIAIYIAGSFGIGGMLGIFAGGYYAELHTWRSIFLVSALPAPIVLPCVWIFFEETRKIKTKRYDFLGTFFYLVMIGSLVTYLSNVKQPWTTEGIHSPLMIGMLIFFIFATIGFIWRELTFSQPLIDIRLFKIRPFFLGNLAVFLVGISFFSSTTNFSVIFENDLHYSKYHTSLWQVPYGLLMGLCGSISGLIVKKIGPRIPALSGMFFLVASCFIQHHLTIQSEPKDFLGVLAIRGIGVGLSLGPFTAIALRRVPEASLGQAAVLVTLFRQLGAALGSIVIDLIRSLRFPFHLLRFGEQMNLQSPALEEHLKKSQTLLVDQGGSIPDVASYGAPGFTDAASTRSTEQLREYASAQAEILSINDAYWIIGWVSLFLLLIILSIMVAVIYKEHHRRKQLSSPLRSS